LSGAPSEIGDEARDTAQQVGTGLGLRLREVVVVLHQLPGGVGLKPGHVLTKADLLLSCCAIEVGRIGAIPRAQRPQRVALSLRSTGLPGERVGLARDALRVETGPVLKVADVLLIALIREARGRLQDVGGGIPAREAATGRSGPLNGL